MKRFLVVALASVGGLVIFGFLFLVAISWALLGSSDPRMPDRFVLELDLTRGVASTPSDDPFAFALDRRRQDLQGIVATLHRAAEDDRVLGLRVRGGQGVGGWAVTEEIRDAVLHFRASGKPALLFAETFGEFAPAQGAYFVATAFDEIVLQPSGEVGLAGLSLEAPFLAGFLDRYDVDARFEARGEYKDAVELFTSTGFSGPSREALEAVLRSLRQGLVEGIAEGRGIPVDSALVLLARGPFSGTEALDAGLVDRLAYADEAREAFDARIDPASGDAALPGVSLRRYAEGVGRAWSRGDRIALVHGAGTIQRGTAPGFDPFGSAGVFAAGTVARHLRDAASDDRTRAIIFRVDSPGGSYVASDVVRREISRAREKGIPVVVSMGNAAASGGYLVSAHADRIVAQPSTLTGSIGVVAGRFELDGLLERFGVTFDAVDLGDAHPFYQMTSELGPDDMAWLARSVERVYDEFVDLVAEGRGMDRDAVHEVARGRVWTGRDAVERGLVDVLGGYPAAIREARELAGLAPDAPVELRRYPAERTFFELLMEEARGGSDPGGLESGTPAGGAWTTAREVVRGAVRLLAALGRDDGAAPVRTEMRDLRIPGF